MQRTTLIRPLDTPYLWTLAYYVQLKTSITGNITLSQTNIKAETNSHNKHNRILRWYESAFFIFYSQVFLLFILGWFCSSLVSLQFMVKISKILLNSDLILNYNAKMGIKHLIFICTYIVKILINKFSNNIYILFSILLFDIYLRNCLLQETCYCGSCAYSKLSFLVFSVKLL